MTMRRRVEVVPYRVEWPAQYQSEANALRDVFGDQLLSIHHFGSTAIPGISAKPIIDILVIVRDIDAVFPLVPTLEAMGYVFKGEYGIPGRRFFYKGTEEVRSHHLHVYEINSPNILRHIAFRDYMRTHPSLASAYAKLKESLARQFPDDMERYIEGKNDFVKEQEKKALMWWSSEHQAAAEEPR